MMRIVTAKEQLELLSPWLKEAAPAQPSLQQTQTPFKASPSTPAWGTGGIHNPFNTGSGGSFTSGGGGGGGGGGAPSASSSPGNSGKTSPPGPGSVPLVQKPDGTWTSSNPEWARLIDRESGGNPSIGQQGCDANGCKGSPNASQGLFQFTPATWAGAGGGKYGPNPGQATPQQQGEIAGDLLRKNPSGSDWGAGQPGREDAGALAAGLSP